MNPAPGRATAAAAVAGQAKAATITGQAKAATVTGQAKAATVTGKSGTSSRKKRGSRGPREDKWQGRP